MAGAPRQAGGGTTARALPRRSRRWQKPELADGTQYSGASVGMHLYLPIARRMVWLGEAYLGDNLADIGGAIDQDFNPMTRRNIHGAGGWLELATLPTERHMLAVGASIDTARDADLAPGDRERNRTMYAVLRYQPLASLQLGVEYPLLADPLQGRRPGRRQPLRSAPQRAVLRPAPRRSARYNRPVSSITRSTITMIPAGDQLP